MSSAGIPVQLGAPINVDGTAHTSRSSSVDDSSSTPTLAPSSPKQSTGSGSKLHDEKAAPVVMSEKPHQTPVYHRTSEDGEHGAPLQRPAQPNRQSTFTNMINRVTSGLSQNRDRDYPDDEVSSFDRAISRRTEQEKEGWSLEGVMKRDAERDAAEGKNPRRLDVSWKDLCVRGVGADAVFADDLTTMFNPMTKRNDKKRKAALDPDLEKETKPQASEKRQKDAEKSLPDHGSQLGPNEKFLLQDFTGTLKSGEMALVLGRPGAGCTTFMKALTNIRQGYAGVDGDIRYGTMDSKEAEKYSSQIQFVAEDEVFYPDLTVDQTIKFALKMRTPSDKARPQGVSREEYEASYRDTLLKTFGIEHTVDTKVGNESVRGVSGGERKRVTLAEALVNRAPVYAFDQPTRGLDASTALEFTQAMRTITDYQKTTTFISVYQAGNQIYELFDKILVIAAGRCIYWGPMKEARGYFEDMGFQVSPGSNLSDFLTAVTVATERVVAEDKKGKVPNTPEEFAVMFKQSDINARMLKEIEELRADEELLKSRTEDLKESVVIEKSKRAGKKGPYTTTLATQVASATRRQYALTWNDKASLGIKQGGMLIQSVILGSLFYMLDRTTNGLFGKAGVLFLTLLVNALLGLGEVVNSFKGRTILAKHKAMALYRPSALIFAQVMVDIPLVALQVTMFLVPIYFMSGLRRTAGAFFTLWIVTYVTTHSLLGFFRMIGFSFSSFQGAGAVSGLALGLIILTMGYLLPNAQLPWWVGWFKYLNPLFYALETAFINEFNGTTIECAAPALIPYGQGYPTTGDNIVCNSPGATTGETSFPGRRYIEDQYGYRVSHKWRNFGLIIMWWFVYLVITCLAVERLKAAGSVKSFLVFARRKVSNKGNDAESGKAAAAGSETAPVRSDDDIKIDKSETLFAWKDLCYTVPVRGGHRQLLNKVQGFTKPGAMLALMGASGAGKTTLLDVLGARKDDGKIEGDITVDGRPPGPSFQRTCGYVGQMDVHEPTQTIREAFLFSARLRQPRETSDEEIESYVNKVIEILELEELADAIIGVPGAGLSIEQRKRTTIGVELVAKPKLLFLDEPTSGLDGQSAYQILRFLKKLSAAGQSMLVTVHQPSALLFEQFDSLLLLAKGGRTVYNGELGKHASTMKEYFAKQGAKIGDEENAAEAMIDIVSGARSKGHDWAQVWLDSEEYQTISKEVDNVIKEAKEKPASFEEDGLYYASSLGMQTRLVTKRAWSSIIRTPDYVMGRVGLVIGTGLITGITFVTAVHTNDYRSVQNRLLATFQAMFVAPGLFNILQPRVIEVRTLYESREKGAKMYGWFPFIFSVILTEIPWLLMSEILNFAAWFPLVFWTSKPTDPYHGGSFWFQDVLYFLWIGGFAQFVAICSPTAEAAALFNSIPLGLMASFSGVLLPYPQIPAWWRYWIYYLNPWSYILGGKIFFVNWNVEIRCKDSEFSVLQPPAGQTCGAYLSDFLATAAGYVDNPDANADCRYCGYANGNEYLRTLNINDSYIGWRNIGITALWVMAFWGFTVGAMAWRSRKN